MVRTPCDAAVIESAFQRFPTELLGEVFAQALEGDVTDPSPETMKRLIDICLVSREWCATARITHTLWRTLVLLNTLSPRTFEKARTWLNRAGALPKSLAVVATKGLRAYCHDRTDCSLASWELATMLMDGIMDFYHLSITCPSSVCFYQLLTLFEEVRRRTPVKGHPRPWESVKSISFDFFEDWNQWDDHQDPNQDILTSGTYPIFLQLPPVASLSLRVPSVGSDSETAEWAALNIPDNRLGNLTELTLACGWLPRKILKVLEGCRNVKRLTLDLDNSFFFGGDACAGLDDKATLLPKVRKLHIRGLERSSLGYLRYFRMPLLEDLVLEFMKGNLFSKARSRSIELVVDLFQRSQCANTLSTVQLRHAFPMDVQHLQLRLPFMSKPHFHASQTLDLWTLSRALPPSSKRIA